MNFDSCIFCKIVQKQIPSPRIAENDEFICIRDIQPQARHHYLVITKEHVASLAEAFPASGASTPEDARLAALMGRMIEFGTKLARTEELLPDGFRMVINTNRNGGQTVFHIHMHVLGGESLRGSFA